MMMNLLSKYSPVFAPEDGAGTGASPPSGGAAPPSEPHGAPSSSPASTPSSTPTPSGSPEGEPGFDFGSVFGDAPSAEVPTEIAPPVVTPPTPPQAAPVAAPQEPPASAPAQAPGPATPPAPPAAPAELDRYDPGVLSRHLAANEEQALTYVAENVFRMSPQEVEALETNVVDAIPKLLAKVFVKSQQNVLSQLSTMVPMMIQRQTVAMRKNDEGVEQFYARWPMIKKSEHNDLVMKYAVVYRQMHPGAQLSQMVEDLGPMILMAARISPQAAPGQPVTRAGANGVRPPPSSPFVPAGSAAPVASSTAPEISPWEAMFRQE